MRSIDWGIHAGVWGFDWTTSTAASTINAAAHAGFDVLEIPACNPQTEIAGETARLLGISTIRPTVSLALGPDSDINSTDPITSLAGERQLEDAVDFAAMIGARFVGGVVFSAMDRYRHLPSESARANSVAVLSRIAERAREHDIVIGVEYVNRYESNLLNTVEQTLRFIGDVGAENVTLHLDTFHAHIEEISVPDAIRSAGDLLGYVHASESHRGELGTGALDWNQISRAIHEKTGPLTVTVESFSPAVIGRDKAIDIALWRTMWTEPDTMARDAHRYLVDVFAGAYPTISSQPIF